MSEEQNKDFVAELHDLFVYRDELYNETTALILQNIQPTLLGIVSYIKVPADKTEWESVELIGDVVVFRLKVLTDKRESVTNNMLYRIVTIGLPLDLVASATDGELVKMFLQNVENIKKHPNDNTGSVELSDEDFDNSMESLEEAIAERKTKKVLH